LAAKFNFACLAKLARPAVLLKEQEISGFSIEKQLNSIR
jgi:hypothetical protein